MNKILVGVIVGAVLGADRRRDGLVHARGAPQMLGIIIGSTIKGVIAGVAAGWFARRVQSVPKGSPSASSSDCCSRSRSRRCRIRHGRAYWWQIMVPGSILGGVIGWATQRYGRPRRRGAPSRRR